jgi:lysophospholipase L1-like esterase
VRVVLLGDSHLARVQRGLPRIGPDVDNAAVGGSVAGDVLAQAAQVGVGPDDVVVLSIGTNDDMPANDVALSVFGARVTEVAGQLAPARWVYLTPPLPESAAYGEMAVAALTEAHPDVVVLDVPALLGPLGDRAFLEDDLHLTGASYDVLLPAIAAAVDGA